MDRTFVLAEFDRLTQCGVVFYDEKQQTVELIDGHLKIQFILTSALAQKPTIHSQRKQYEEKHQVTNVPRAGSDINTLGFELGNVGEGHFVAINKYCFARPHLMLLTTDASRKQHERLYRNDLDATWGVLETMGSDYLAFYNCGKIGGCSRLHKHLQIMPKPRENFASFLDEEDRPRPALPFQLHYRRFKIGQITSRFLAETYDRLLDEATKVNDSASNFTRTISPEIASPHNMILTSKWMIVLPRRQAAINTEAGVNAMGMLGVVAVATRDEMKNWEKIGLWAVLGKLGVACS